MMAATEQHAAQGSGRAVPCCRRGAASLSSIHATRNTQHERRRSSRIPSPLAAQRGPPCGRAPQLAHVARQRGRRRVAHGVGGELVVASNT
jgi:hypothetical protein